MKDSERDLDRRLREHYRSLPASLPDDLVDRARVRIRAGARNGRPVWHMGLAAAAIGALGIGVVAFIQASPRVPPPGPSASSASSPSSASSSPSSTSGLVTTYRPGDVLIVTGPGLGDPIEAYRGDRLYVVGVNESSGPTTYQLEGPPRSAQEDASRVELPVELVEGSTEPTTVSCPDLPLALSQLETLRPFERFVCYRETALTLRDIWVGAVTLGSAELGPNPVGRLARFEEPESGWIPFSVVQGVVVPVGWSTVTGTFGKVDSSCGDWAGRIACRERFVVDAVAAGTSPFTQLAGTWTRMSDAPIPGRSSYVALDIDRGTFFWGGDGQDPTAGAIFQASSDIWTQVSHVDDSAPRYQPAAVWTGRDVLIWGGNDDPEGLAYNPAADRWATIPPAPIVAGPAIGAWTGSEFLVVSGAAQAAAWNPESRTWRRLPDPPIARGAIEGVWTGSELIVLGLTEGWNDPIIGAAMNQELNSWRNLAEVPYNGLALGTRPVWTGSVMLFSRHSYDPATDRWRPLSTEGCLGRDESSGVWTGRWVIGQIEAYNPSSGRCVGLPEAPRRPGFEEVGPIHEFDTPAWDSGRLIVWSGGTGLDGPGSPPDGIVFTPGEP